MSGKNNLDNTKKGNIQEKEMKKIAKNLDKSLKYYRQNIAYLAGDAPISLLCLPKTIEKILLDNGLDRIYCLFDRDLTEITGLGDVRIRDLTARLKQFFAMC